MVGIRRFHQYDTSIITDFQCQLLHSWLEASTKEVTPIAACSTFSAAQTVQQSPPAAKACFQSFQFCTTVPLHESIGSVTLAAFMQYLSLAPCNNVPEMYSPTFTDYHSPVAGVPFVLVSTTNGSKCHCSSGFNVSWPRFGRCVASLGLNKHSKAWFCKRVCVCHVVATVEIP